MPLCGKNENLPAINSLVTLFEAAVFCCPNKTALIDADTDETVTFFELSGRSNQLARFLINALKDRTSADSHGDNTVAICIPPSIDLIVAIIALLKINCAYLPLDVNFPSSRVDYIISDAKPPLLLIKGSPPATIHLNSDKSLHILELENISNQVLLEDSGTLSKEEQSQFSSNELLTAVLYTSGSTGVPKGVRLPQRATLNRLIWQWRHFPYADGEVCCFKTALTFVDSISEIFGSLLTGHSLVIIPKVMTVEVDDLIKVLEKFKVGRIILVPSLLHSILALASSRKQSSLNSVKLWVCSGEVFPTNLLKSFFNIFCNDQSICNFYGSTEVLGDVTYIQFKNLKDVDEKLFENKVPIGMPISNCQIYLMGSNLQKEVEDGEIGEIFVSGANLSCGYIGKTLSYKFIRNPLRYSEFDLLYRTGDFGKYINGQLHYAGRTDSQMKIRGHRVDINEVELALQSVEGVDKSQVICHKPGEVDQALLGFFTSKSLTIKCLQAELSLLLLNYMVPQCILINEIPLLVNGKVDRQGLLKLYEKKVLDLGENRKFDISDCEADKKDLAMKLLKTVSKVLGPTAPTRLSLNQNFFEMGGNSLNSILTITSLQDAGLHIGIHDFIIANNFAEILLKLVDEQTNTSCNYLHSKEENPLITNNSRKYKVLPMTENMVEDVVRIISKTLPKKETLTSTIKATTDSVSFTIGHMMQEFLKQNLSIVACLEDTGEVVAVSLNHDLHKVPAAQFNSEKFKIVFDFLDFCEEAVSDQLPSGVGNVFHDFIVAVDDAVPPNERVHLVNLMEQENVELAKQKGFNAVLTSNTSPITMQVCEDILGYKNLKTFQVNKYVRKDGSKPYAEVPDDVVVIVYAYYISK